LSGHLTLISRLRVKIIHPVAFYHLLQALVLAFLTIKIIYMKTLQHPYAQVYRESVKEKSLATRFFDWCKSQEKYRFGWLAAIIAGHGCVITPVTLFFVMIAGNSPLLWAFVMAAMAMSLITNLAALPTKITIPVFFLSVLIDVMVIASCVAVL
jgi:hypothetical protein